MINHDSGSIGRNVNFNLNPITQTDKKANLQENITQQSDIAKKNEMEKPISNGSTLKKLPTPPGGGVEKQIGTPSSARNNPVQSAFIKSPAQESQSPLIKRCLQRRVAKSLLVVQKQLPSVPTKAAAKPLPSPGQFRNADADKLDAFFTQIGTPPKPLPKTPEKNEDLSMAGKGPQDQNIKPAQKELPPTPENLSSKPAAGKPLPMPKAKDSEVPKEEISSLKAETQMNAPTTTAPKNRERLDSLKSKLQSLKSNQIIKIKDGDIAPRRRSIISKLISTKGDNEKSDIVMSKILNELKEIVQSDDPELKGEVVQILNKLDNNDWARKAIQDEKGTLTKLCLDIFELAGKKSATEIQQQKIELNKANMKDQSKKEGNIKNGTALLGKMKAVNENMSLAQLHSNNINTPGEILNGYRSVMTTDELFISLGNAYKNETDSSRKKTYVDFASSWLNTPMYQNELANQEIKDVIKNFLDIVKQEDSLNAQSLIDKYFSDSVSNEKLKTENSQGQPIAFLSGLAHLCNNDPKLMAQEFRSFFSDLQSKITVGDQVNREKNIRCGVSNSAAEAGGIPQKLLGVVIQDLLVSKSKSEAAEKYKLYLNVAHEALTNGDTATLMYIQCALNHPAIERLELVSKNDVGILKDITEACSPVNTYKNLKSIIENNPDAPIDITNISQRELVMLTEGNSTQLSEGEHLGEINAGLIELAGKHFENFSKRQQAMKKNSTHPTVDLATFFKNTPKIDEIGFYSRSKEIRTNNQW